MYKQYLKVQPSKIGGTGTFTTVKIPANTPIMEIAGKVTLEQDLKDPDSEDILQIGPNTYLTSAGDAGDHINHSCEPNCKMHVVGNRAILYSLYVIPVGAELTFDYSTTATDDMDKWQMACKCGSYQCRKIISGFQHLDSNTQDIFKNKDMVPLYILQPHMLQKR